ncbi:MAG: hypothetical protein R3F62_02555 [Planctomycetota bacterium]
MSESLSVSVDVSLDPDTVALEFHAEQTSRIAWHLLGLLYTDEGAHARALAAA